MARTFAYCRVSTTDQTHENQIHEIDAAGFHVEPRRVISETVSGSVPAMERKEFRSLVARLDWDDVLIVTKLGRPRSLATNQQTAVRQMRAEGASLGALAKKFGVSRSAIQRLNV